MTIQTARPGILERAKIAYDVFRNGFPNRVLHGSSETKAAPFTWPGYQEGKPQWHLSNLEKYAEEGFNANAILYAAIMYKVRSITQAPLKAYSGDREQSEPLPAQHALTQFLRHPNPAQTMNEFMGAAIVYLNVAGNCYIFLDRPSRNAPPEAMYTLRPDRVFIVPGDRGIRGYVYKPEGKSIYEPTPILPHNILHIRLPAFLDDFEGMGYGLSPISPMAKSADVDNQVTSFLKLFFERGGMQFGSVNFPMPVDDKTLARLRTEWDEMYGGHENWVKPLFFDQGGSYQRLLPTFNEMGFEAIDSRNERRILGPLGVPGMLIGARSVDGSSTFSNWEQADRAFWQNTFEYELQLFENKFEDALSPESDTFVAFDRSQVPALQRDIVALVNAASTMIGHGVPANDAYKLVGLKVPELPAGKTAFMASSLTILETDGKGNAVKPDPPPMAAQPGNKPPLADEPPVSEDDTQEAPAVTEGKA